MFPDARKAYPSALYGTSHGANSVATHTAHHMTAAVNTFAAYTVLSVDAHAECQERRDDARERARRRDHEHDDHLQPRCLLHIRTAEDRAGHHTRYRDDTCHAVDNTISEGDNSSNVRHTSFG